MNNNDITDKIPCKIRESDTSESEYLPAKDPVFGGEITVKNLQTTVDEWITGIGNGYYSPLTNMAILAEETGEVARQMSRIYGDQTFKAGETSNLADELADVVWVVAAIANQTGVDLTEALQKNIEKKTNRDRNRNRRLQ